MSRYNLFLELFLKSNPNKPKNVAYKEGNTLWKEVKHDPEQVDKKISEFKDKSAKIESKQRQVWSGFRSKDAKPSTSTVAKKDDNVAAERPSKSFPSTSKEKEKNCEVDGPEQVF